MSMYTAKCTKDTGRALCSDLAFPLLAVPIVARLSRVSRQQSNTCATSDHFAYAGLWGARRQARRKYFCQTFPSSQVGAAWTSHTIRRQYIRGWLVRYSVMIGCGVRVLPPPVIVIMLSRYVLVGSAMNACCSRSTCSEDRHPPSCPQGARSPFCQTGHKRCIVEVFSDIAPWPRVYLRLIRVCIRVAEASGQRARPVDATCRCARFQTRRTCHARGRKASARLGIA